MNYVLCNLRGEMGKFVSTIDTEADRILSHSPLNMIHKIICRLSGIDLSWLSWNIQFCMF